MNKITALKAACKKTFKQGEDPNILEVISSYKAFIDIDDDEEIALYNYIADWCGISNYQLLTKNQYKLLLNNGFISE